MNLLKTIDNFYTYTLDGFIKRYKYEQGITGYLGLSFLSNFMSLIRNSIVYSYNFVTSSYPFKLICSVISDCIEIGRDMLSTLFSYISKGFAYSSTKAIEFAEGPFKTFAKTKALPAIKDEFNYIKEKTVTFTIGAGICLYSTKSLYNLAFNLDNTKKYTYPELGCLVFSGFVDCGLIYLSATALMSPKMNVGSNKLTTAIACCFFANYIFKQNISASASRS